MRSAEFFGGGIFDQPSRRRYGAASRINRIGSGLGPGPSGLVTKGVWSWGIDDEDDDEDERGTGRVLPDGSP
jgi:hypothetical protein